MKLKILAVTLLAAFVLTACNEESADQGKASIENESQDIKEMVQRYSSNKSTDQSASITSQELIVKDSEGKEKVYDISDEAFFASIAPYINETHP